MNPHDTARRALLALLLVMGGCETVDTLQDAFDCRANDSFGNSYAGNSKSPDNPKFFRAL